MTSTIQKNTKPQASLQLYEMRVQEDFPDWLELDELAAFLHDNMKPYEDTVSDIRRALRYALSPQEGMGGFILAAVDGRHMVGSVVILDTGMSGYIPEHILVFVGVRPDLRGQGIGGWLVKEALARCKGDVKLHVEYDNPAKRLYERIGFNSKYAEMRYTPRR
jgi:ribosomal-protein-alanine N-acetyltransferase